MEFNEENLYVGDIIINCTKKSELINGKIVENEQIMDYRTLLYKMSENVYYDLYNKRVCEPYDSVVLESNYAIKNLYPFKEFYKKASIIEEMLEKCNGAKLYKKRFEK